MFRNTRITMTLALLAGVALLALACSSQNPVSSGVQSTRGLSGLASIHDTEFDATLATADATTRTLTFSDSPEIVVVTPQAEIQLSTGSGSQHITFADLKAGDHVRIRGNRQPDNSVLADQVEVHVGDDQGEDDEFRTSITSLNYVDSSFTVNGRTETIRVDANTRIVGHVRGGGVSAASGGGHDDQWSDDNGRDTAITFASLIVGDSVEVHVRFVDATTLLATTIQMEDEFENEAVQVEFKDELATVDVTGGVVTFQTEHWIGVLDAGAELLDLDRNPVTLAAFVPGQLVEVKGIDSSNDTLLVVRLRMDNN